ncbi:MAG: GNAT family N-acetyltransferase [Spirochaetaceae bacterium]|jgi:predicted GNAT family acetyltransferase|nr:GNAT family N-acetyltransferase [Spirochaetaceae bacterium]
MIKKRRWRHITKKTAAALEAFLKTEEPYCVAACSRVLHTTPQHNEIWGLFSVSGEVEAVLLCFHQSFFPVFRGNETVPAPYFLRYQLLINPIHALQGLARDTEIFGNSLAKLGLVPRETRNYDLMELAREPRAEYFSLGPGNLEIRKPSAQDADALFRLQAAYEVEEVLPNGAGLNLSGCRLAAENIIRRDHSFIAVLDKRPVGKINVSAVSYNYSQAGGVYVLPEYRGRGIAQRLGAVFARSVLAEGKKVSLFVKKKNAAAKKVYANLGFSVIGDYRISYY